MGSKMLASEKLAFSNNILFLVRDWK